MLLLCGSPSLSLSHTHTAADRETDKHWQIALTRVNTCWDCGSRGAAPPWRWAASQHILSAALDIIWWLVRCNWSTDYYLSCACQIKIIIKKQAESDGEQETDELLHSVCLCLCVCDVYKRRGRRKISTSFPEIQNRPAHPPPRLDSGSMYGRTWHVLQSYGVR